MMFRIIEFASQAGPYLYIAYAIAFITTLFGAWFIARFFRSPFEFFDFDMIATNAHGEGWIDALKVPVSKIIGLIAILLLCSVGVVFGLSVVISTLAPAKDATLPTAIKMLEAKEDDGSLREAKITYQPRLLINDEAQVSVEVSRSASSSTQTAVWYAASPALVVQSRNPCPENRPGAGDRKYGCASSTNANTTLSWTFVADKPGEKKLTLGPDPAVPLVSKVLSSSDPDNAFSQWLFSMKPPSIDASTGRVVLPVLVLTSSGLTQTTEARLTWLGMIMSFLFGSGVLLKFALKEKE